MKLQRFTNGKVARWSLYDNEVGLNEYMAEVVPSKEIRLLEINLWAGLIRPIDPFLEVTGDDPFYEFSWATFPAASPALLAVSQILEEEPRPRIPIDWEQLEATPEAVRFQLSQKWWGCFDTGAAFELARFITHKNETGLIKSIQTEVNFESNSFPWPRGDSSYFKRLLDNTPGSEVGEVRIKWCVKIEGIGEIEPSPSDFRVNGLVTPANWISEIPGMVHPEINPWEEMLFIWGRDHYVRLRCPANSLVSLWVYAYPQANPTGLWSAGGMFKGQCQMEGSDQTYFNMTRMD